MEQNNRTLDAFAAQMKERDKKAKQQAFMRIGFGVLLLIIGIIGIRRRKKTVK